MNNKKKKKLKLGSQDSRDSGRITLDAAQLEDVVGGAFGPPPIIKINGPIVVSSVWVLIEH